jgi:hypothetical protein
VPSELFEMIPETHHLPGLRRRVIFGRMLFHDLNSQK